MSAEEREQALIGAHQWSDVHPDLHVSVCIGAAAGDSSQIEALAARADAALYAAKAEGGGNCVVF